MGMGCGMGRWLDAALSLDTSGMNGTVSAGIMTLGDNTDLLDSMSPVVAQSRRIVWL